MKTLLIVPALFSSEGGIERLMRVTLKALCETAATGDSVKLLALNDDVIPADRLAPYINNRLVSAAGGGRRRIRFFATALRACLASDRVICGHFHLLPILGFARFLKPRLQLFQFAHGIEVWRPWTAREQRIVKRGINLLSISAFTKSRVLDRCPGLDSNRIQILPCPFDPTTPLPVGQAAKVPGRIITVSRLSSEDRYKGIDQLIEAMSLIRQFVPMAQLRIIGKGNDRFRLEALAQQHAPDAVTFAGFVPDEAMADEYARASVFALPSREEGFGIVYLESYLQGTPCVAVRAGAAPEVVRPEFGELATPSNVPDLAQACVRALTRTWDPAALKKHALTYAFPEFCRRLDSTLSGALPNPPTPFNQ